MPGPVRALETFSVGAGFDLGASWSTGNDGGSGSVDPDHAAQSWMRSIYSSELRVINAAGNGVNQGQAFALLILPTTQNDDSVVFGYGVEAHSLGVSQLVGSFLVLDATVSVIMFLCQLVTDASSNLFIELYSYATGVPVAVPVIGHLAFGITVPLRFRFGVSVNGANVYTASLDDGLGGVQTMAITDVPRQTTKMGAIVFGNLSRVATIQPATQIYSYIQLGDVAAAGARLRMRSSVVPALALAFMGHLFRRVASGLWLPTLRLPELPVPGVA